MTSAHVQASDRDAQVVTAMRRAIRSMRMIDGLEIQINEMTGYISFGHEIDTLTEAIQLMGQDPNG